MLFQKLKVDWAPFVVKIFFPQETREQDQPGNDYKNALNEEQFNVAKASEDGDTLFSVAEVKKHCCHIDTYCFDFKN